VVPNYLEELSFVNLFQTNSQYPSAEDFQSLLTLLVLQPKARMANTSALNKKIITYKIYYPA
jgi:hypothetical protein